MTISVVLPMFHTAPMLPELHRRIDASTGGMDVEFVLIDDACDEGSGIACAALASTDPRVKVITHTTNRGQHKAIRTGLTAASGATVVVLDADLQDPPEAIPLLVAAIDGTAAHAVFAGRRGRYQGAGRTLTGRAFKWILGAVAGAPFEGGGFVALSRPAVEATLRTPVDRFYLLAAVAAGGSRMTSVPVERDHRPAGRSATSSRSRVSLAQRGLTTAWQLRRTRKAPQ